MTYSIQTLAQAFAAALKETPREKHPAIAKNFMKLLAKQQLLPKAAKILALAERIAQKQSGVKNVLITSARPLPRQTFEVLRARFRAADRVQEKVEPAAIAGVKIMIDDETVLDNTLARKLKKLFH